MITSFYKYLQRINEEGPPPAPPGGGAPDPTAGGAPGGAPPDPMAGLGGGGGMGGPPPGGDPSMGGGTPLVKKAVDVTTVWNVLKDVLGKDAEHQDVTKPHHYPQNKKEEPKKQPKSLMQ